VFVRGFERFGDLPRNRQRFIYWNAARRAGNPIRQRRPLHEFEDEGRIPVVTGFGRTFFNSVNRGDVRMIQGCEDLRFALEAREAIGVMTECFGQDFECDIAIEPRVARAIDLAHSACSEQTENLVRAEPLTG
jgi:hypothetical protein